MKEDKPSQEVLLKILKWLFSQEFPQKALVIQIITFKHQIGDKKIFYCEEVTHLC